MEDSTRTLVYWQQAPFLTKKCKPRHNSPFTLSITNPVITPFDPFGILRGPGAETGTYSQTQCEMEEGIYGLGNDTAQRV